MASTVEFKGEVFERGNPKAGAKVLIKGQGIDTVLITGTDGKYKANLLRPRTSGQINFSTVDCNNKNVTKTAYYLPRLTQMIVAFENCPLSNFFFISGNTVANGNPVGKINFKVVVGEQWKIVVKDFVSNEDGSFFEKIDIGRFSFGFFSIAVVDCDGRTKVQFKNFFEKDKTTNVDVRYCSTDNYRKIIGTVKKSGQALTRGSVKLDLFKYSPEDHKVLKVDSAVNGIYGYYSLNAPSQGKYLVKATPIDNLTHAIPQYFGSGHTWTEGELISIENQSTFRKDISLPGEIRTKGESVINGNTIFDEMYLGDKNPNNYTLVLFDTEMNPIKFVWPSKSGEFSFHNLDKGSYFIHLDVVGLPSNPIMVTIEDDGEIVSDVKIYVNNAGVEYNAFTSTAFHEELSNEVLAYPNPFQNEIRLSIESNNSQITVRDIQGKVMFLENIYANSYSIPTFEWESGVYVIEVKTPTSVENIKLIKR